MSATTKSPRKATLTSMLNAIRNNEEQKFVKAVNRGADIFALDADGHSLMWHARRSPNPIYAEMLMLIADGKSFSDEEAETAAKESTSPIPSGSATPADAEESEPQYSLETLTQGLSQEVGQRCWQRLREQILLSQIPHPEEKKVIESLPLHKLPEYLSTATYRDGSYTLLQRMAHDKKNPIFEELWYYQSHPDEKINRLNAINNGHFHLITLYIEQGADVNETDQNEDSLLHKAVKKKNKGIVKLLLDHGADVNAVNRTRQTALATLTTMYVKDYLSEDEWPTDIVTMLIKNGADSHMSDIFGASPYQQAKKGFFIDTLVSSFVLILGLVIVWPIWLYFVDNTIPWLPPLFCLDFCVSMLGAFYSSVFLPLRGKKPHTLAVLIGINIVFLLFIALVS